MTNSLGNSPSLSPLHPVMLGNSTTTGDSEGNSDIGSRDPDEAKLVSDQRLVSQSEYSGCSRGLRSDLLVCKRSQWRGRLRRRQSQMWPSEKRRRIMAMPRTEMMTAMVMRAGVNVDVEVDVDVELESELELESDWAVGDGES